MKIIKANKVLTSEALNAEMIVNENTRKANENARKVWETYNNTKAYVVGNKVVYNGSSYICIQNATGKIPTSYPTFWQLIAAAGAGLTDASQLSITDAGNYFTSSNAGDALQEVGQRVGDLSSLNTTSNTDLVGGINENKESIDTINSDLGEKLELLTTDKSNFVGAVNEINANVGNKNSLLTTIKTSIVNAINELFTSVNKKISKGEFVFNVKDYGAVSDYNSSTGVGTDSTAAFIATFNAAKLVNGTIEIPYGKYLITQINIDASVKWKSSRINGAGATLYTKSNLPMFYVTSASTFEGLSIIGSDNVVYTLQDGIYVNNISVVTIRDCYFDNLYNCIHVKDGVFYSSVENCKFYSAQNAFIYGEGTNTQGYQITINHCVASVNYSKYGFYFANAGTVTIDDLEMSPTGCTDGGVVFASLAVLAGVQQINHSRLEGSSTNGLQLLGTVSNPIKNFYVSNTYIAGDASVYADYAIGVFFSNCFFTGSSGGAVGKNAFYALHEADNICFSNCQFEVTNIAITAGIGCISVGINVTNPIFKSTHPLIDVSSLDASIIKQISVSGGTVGSHLTPIKSNTYASDKVNINVPGNNQHEAWMIPTLLNGWLDYGGNYPVGYYKKNGRVNLRGMIKSGTVAAGTLLFTLPFGYRPITRSMPSTISNAAGIATPINLEIYVNGEVHIGNFAAGATFLSIDNISFTAES